MEHAGFDVEVREVDNLESIKQALGVPGAHNALGVPIAAGVLYPLFGVLLSPMIAALAMSMSSVSVVSNALRLGRAGRF